MEATRALWAGRMLLLCGPEEQTRWRFISAVVLHFGSAGRLKPEHLPCWPGWHIMVVMSALQIAFHDMSPWFHLLP